MFQQRERIHGAKIGENEKVLGSRSKNKSGENEKVLGSRSKNKTFGCGIDRRMA
jgi:hypothetical protein